MSYKSFTRDLRAGALSRRQILGALASAGLVASIFPIRARAAVNLTVFTWAGYDDAMFHGGFVKQHDASPEFSLFGESEEGLQKLRSGFAPDIAHPCTSSVSRWKDAGVLRPLDVQRIEQWNKIFPNFREIPGVVIGDAYYNMPFDWGNESILYRTDLVDISENSIGLLLDERYRGRMAMFDSAESMGAVCGVLSGAKDPFSLTDAELSAAQAVMKKIHANMRFYWTDATQITQALAAGELVAAWAWNAAVVDLKRQGIPVAYMRPREGVFTWICGLSLVKDGAGAEDQAYDFLNAMLDAESGKALITEYGYGHSNARSFELVDRARLEELGIADPEDMLASSLTYRPTPPETKEKLIKIYNEVKLGF